MSEDELLQAINREVIAKKPQEFKIPCLAQVANLFPSGKPFFAGFGNRVTDLQSYSAVNILPQNVYIVDKEGGLSNHGTHTKSVFTYRTLVQDI
jgi:phosphatidate phosphatase LPIN